MEERKTVCGGILRDNAALRVRHFAYLIRSKWPYDAAHSLDIL